MAPTPVRSPRYHYTFGPPSPVLTVSRKQALCVVCPDSDNEFGDGTLLPSGQRQLKPGNGLFEGNPMAGPFFIEGARPGDCVAITIDSIELDRKKGQTLLAYGHGLLSPQLLVPDPANDP